jgi:hypothetical protein
MHTKIKPMKKTILFLSIILTTTFLGGCFSFEDGNSAEGTQSQNNDLTKTYSNNQFSFTYPQDWDLIERKDFTSEIPAETQVVIRNNLKNDSFTANINIVKNTIQNEKSTLDYAKEVLNRQKTGLLDYKETKREIIKISIGGSDQETYYTEFEARLNSTEPITKFFQTYGVKGQNGFVIMGASSTQENSSTINKLQKAVLSFKIG